MYDKSFTIESLTDSSVLLAEGPRLSGMPANKLLRYHRRK